MSISRTSNQQMNNKLKNNIHDQLKRQERLFEEISSNKKILRPSDDPVGASQVLRLKNEALRLEGYQKVAKEGQTWCHFTSTALESAASTWKRVSEIGISASDGTKSEQDRLGMAEELDQLLQHFVQIANTTQSGQYIFGGSQTKQPPFNVQKDAATGRITRVNYQGDNKLRSIKSQVSNNVAINSLGSNAGNPDRQGSFIDSQLGVDTFKTLINLRDRLYSNDTIGIASPGGVLDNIDKAAKNLTAAQVHMGGIEEALNLDINRSASQNSEIDKLLSEIESADTAKLILELNDLQTTYESSLAVGGRIHQRGLLNFL